MNCEWNMHLCYPRKLVRRVAEFMIGASKTSSGYREKKKESGKSHDKAQSKNKPQRTCFANHKTICIKNKRILQQNLH